MKEYDLLDMPLNDELWQWLIPRRKAQDDLAEAKEFACQSALGLVRAPFELVEIK